MRFAKIVAGLAFLAAVSACDREATGQVAAIVNGEEITLQEVNAEIGAAGAPEGADRELIQQAALQRVIERRLLAQSAMDEKLDETQDFLLRERQLREALLVQLLGQKAERTMKVPNETEINAYIDDNPALFGERKVFTVDRIQFPIPQDFARLKALENDHSMDAVAARLRSLNIEFQRGSAEMDSAALGQQRLQQIRSLPAGEPFVIPENGLVTVAVITGERAVASQPARSRQMAAQVMRNDSLKAILDQRLKTARAEAEIDYQDGFAPPAAPGTASAPAASSDTPPKN